MTGAGSERTAPLSFGQHRMWMLSEVSHGAAALNLVMAVRLTGLLHPAALRQALDDVVRRHDILRSVVVVSHGEPEQQVVPHTAARVRIVDLAALPAGPRERAASELLAEATRRPFDLATGPLIMATLVRLGPRAHVLSVAIHHIVGDGWSMTLLAQEVAGLYGALLAGAPSPYSGRPALQFADVARRERAGNRELTPHARSWVDGLRDVVGGGLPLDRGAAVRRSRPAGLWICTLPPGLTHGLTDLRRREGGSAFMLLLAALMAVLARVGGRTDVAVGTFSAGRTRPEYDALIGYFVNVLVVRAGLPAGAPFRDVWRTVRERCIAAYDHQDIPYEVLLEHLAPVRDRQLAPPVSVLCVQQQPTPAIELPGLVVEPVDVPHGVARFDLTVELRPAADHVEIAFQYDADVLDVATVEQLGVQLRSLLEAVVADPDIAWDAVAPVPPDVTAPPLPAAPRASPADLVGRWADTAPDAVALVHGRSAVTYGALEDRADRLARRLTGSGVGVDDVVGVALHRGIASVVAILAVLKAEAGWVPLSPDDPADRLGWLLADAAPVVVLADRADATRFGAVPVLVLDAGGLAVSADPAADLPGGDRSVPGSAAAHLLYTSGSTGRPKGVLGTRAALANRIAWMDRAHPYTPGDRALHRTPLGFVDAVAEVLGPLCGGSQLIIVDDADVRDPAVLAALIIRHHVDRAVVVPALLRSLLATRPDLGRQLGPGGVWVSSGERLPVELADRFHEVLPSTVLLNLYGSTEVAGDATVAAIGPGTGQVDVGRPIDGVTAVVVDAAGAPVPPLVPGDLHIGGHAVARGYHGRPGETAAAFVPDPGRVGARRFRTGDRARAAVGGSLRLLGRSDDQVQVRGVRVEPGEVEDAMRAHPAVRDAAVAAAPDASGDLALIGYAVLSRPCTTSDLLDHLRATLAPHLVPSLLVTVDELPRTTSGKIDRAALPAPDEVHRPGPAPDVPPATSMERAVAQVFADLLPVRWSSVDDDFFALGGHSILATALVHRLAESCGASIGLADVFRVRTIAGLASALESAVGPAPVRAAPSPAAGDPDAPFPLTDVQQAYWIGRDAELELGSVATHSYFEIDATGLDVRRFENALRRLIRRHDALRIVVDRDGRQRVLPTVPEYEVSSLDLRSEGPDTAGPRLAAWRDSLSHQVLPADRWPLFDVRACLMPGGGVRVAVGIDALVADAHSVRILMDELTAVYDDPDVELPVLPLTFRDCVLDALAERTSADHDRALEYWTERLPALPTGPELPLARVPDSLERPRFRRVDGLVPLPTWTRLRRRAEAAGITPAALLLAAFAEVLTAWSTRPHYTLTLTLFDRPRTGPGVDRVVGDFTSLTLLEVDHRQPGTFADRANGLQERLWRDLDHRAAGGVAVLREWTRLRSAGRPVPLAPVVFTSNLGLNADPAARSLGELGFALTQTPQLHLDHQVAESPAGLVVGWDVVDGLYPSGMVEAMHSAFLDLLARLADGSWDVPVGPLLPRVQLAARAAANATSRPRERTSLHTLVATAAARFPERTALVAGDRRMSHGELDARASAVGSALRSAGVERGELVGIAAAKGWQQIVAAHGVAAAGAAYLPLDPALPAARLMRLRELTGVRHVLVEGAARGRLPGLHGLCQWAVEDCASGPDRAVTGRAPVVDSELAYVLFTSGSTGEPKGVMIDQRGAVGTVTDVNRRWRVGPEDSVLGLSSLTFDLSVYDVFGVLGAGGAIVLPDAARTRDPGHWLDLVQRERVTLWNSVPALMELAVEASELRGADAALASLRLVLLSGDWIPLTLPERVRGQARRAMVVGLGGATECSIWSVQHPITALDASWPSVPYGRPLANQQTHVIDPAGRPRPDWVPGELLIAGDGLALGYWGDPAETSRRFVVDAATGQRRYRTGDLARYRPGGQLEFLGRVDRQVKINGFRVEPGEIEAVLAAMPGISACAAVAIGPLRGERRMTVHYVAALGSRIEPAQVRTYLRDRLPEYLVPSTVTVHDALPLTANGKIDVAALAEAAGPGGPVRNGRAAQVPASDELTVELCRLWEDVLGVDRVAPDDDFFALGGTSLVGVRLLNAVGASYGVTIGLVGLYEAPTVASLAAEIYAASPSETAERTSALVADPAARFEPFPLTAVQEAYWIGRRRAWELGGVAGQSYLELDVVDLDVGRLERAVDRVVHRHDALRTVVLRDGNQRVLRAEDIAPYRVEVVDLRPLDQAVARGVLGELRERWSHQVSSADEWPLFDIRVTRTDDRRCRMHLRVDLLTADALSFRILREDLLACYAADGAAAQLPPAPRCSFRDYVLAAGRSVDDPARERARRYWTARLPSLPPGPRLPRSVPGGGRVATGRFERLTGGLDSARWTRLQQIAASRRLTPSALICAAFADVLALWSQSGRFTLNLTTFNRLPLHPDVDAVVGDFTATTLVEVDATGPTFASRAATLQRQIFSDLDHREVTGIDVLRMLRADPVRRADATAPVVFTSTLVPDGPASRAPAPSWDAELVYGVSQTPQVLIDHQVHEHAGVLSFTWDHVADAFPPGLVEAMFNAHVRLLGSLLDGGAYWEAAPGWTTT